MSQVEDAKYNFFLKKFYSTEKITVVKIIYLPLFHFIEFFFCHKLFLECFLVEFPYFPSFMMIKIFLVYKSNTEQSLQQHIFCFLINSQSVEKTGLESREGTCIYKIWSSRDQTKRKSLFTFPCVASYIQLKKHFKTFTSKFL